MQRLSGSAAAPRTSQVKSRENQPNMGKIVGFCKRLPEPRCFCCLKLYHVPTYGSVQSVFLWFLPTQIAIEVSVEKRDATTPYTTRIELAFTVLPTFAFSSA